MPKTLSDIAEVLGGVIEGDGTTVIEGVAGLEDAGPGDIVFVENARHAQRAASTTASAAIVPHGVAVPGKPSVAVADPRLAFVRVLEMFEVPTRRPHGIAPTARIGEGVSLGEGVGIADYCCIGKDVTIGERTVLYPFVYVGDGATIGPDTVLFPHVTLYRDVHVGARVRIHAGSVIGADGFGYVQVDGHHHKIPHLGTVVIEDDVEIGACVCVDRAKTDETRIGRGTKVDNLVQLAHNVRTGENCVIIAQVGIAGSSTLGDWVVIAGQTGINGHIEIGTGAQIGGQSGVYHSVPPGAIVSGHPARDHKEHLRLLVATQRVPEMVHTVRDLAKRVQELEQKLAAVAGKCD